MLLAPRAPGEAFTPADRRLLGAFARHVAVVVQAWQLAAELQRSRERLVAAHEVERRRLRRDLHDGIGPALASMTLQSEAALDTLRNDPQETERLLADLATQLHEARTEIRRLADALGPGSLADLGLIAALRTLATRHERAGLRVAIDGPDHPPAIPAGVEVATYRIVQEALANVVRHARARSCVVRLAFANGVDVEVIDDGIGLPDRPRQGVGLASMRERAAELGGSFRVDRAPEGGTRVAVSIPIPAVERPIPAPAAALDR